MTTAMDDLISRQAAIDKAIMIPIARIVTEDKVIWRKAVFVEDIEKLPPAQPEFFEWCHDCKEYDQTEHCCHRWTKVIRQTVEELKAQPERKKGRWNDIDAETYTWKIRCDQCGHERSMLSTGQMYPRFCENCGADMRKGGDYEQTQKPE